MKKIFYILLCSYILCTATSVMSTKITLMSSDNKPIVVPKEIANFSKTIKKLLEDVEENEEPIPVPNVSSKMLKEIFKELSTITTDAKKHLKGNGYVTGDVQKIIDKALLKNENSNPIFIQEYINVVNYLNIPILLNASARFIVENNMSQKIELPSAILPYLKKHQQLVSNRISELTVADYLTMHPSNKLTTTGTMRTFFNVGLTSLFGINQLENADTIEWLIINYNSVLDPADDPDFPKAPFKNMVNLKRISLEYNQLPLSFLPEIFFNGLKNLTRIDLYQDRLTNLPEHLFKGLDKLEVVDLSKNQLDTLPENIFNNLVNLKAVVLSNNNFSQNVKQTIVSAIKAANPDAQITI